jgi:peptidoglycan/xylan/chitin deacetylase (PgdA/CDA1 family)
LPGNRTCSLLIVATAIAAIWEFTALGAFGPVPPERSLRGHKSSDHLPPSTAGYAAMAEAAPLALFSPADKTLKIAITFDDLPVHGPLPPGESRMEVISKIIASLRGDHLPPTYGFVNAVHLEGQPEHTAVLEAWRAAGNLLGNHTWSHMNLDQHSLEEFEHEILRDESALEKLMDGKDWRWFRYPYLAEGETAEKRTALRKFLHQHGYKVAAVTMSFGDYLWNGPYERCETKNDAAEVKKLETSYLKAAEESIEYYRSMSHTLYGRDIAYVLLMHVGAFDAEMLPRLLALYRAKGFEFVSLQEAECDEFYRSSVDLSLSRIAASRATAVRQDLVLGAPEPPRTKTDNLILPRNRPIIPKMSLQESRSWQRIK